MTEPIRDTPSVARPYCPACEPDTDPSLEILDVRWCSAHTPVSGGLDDEAVAMESYPAGSGEAGGEDNRSTVCAFRNLGVRISEVGGVLTVEGKGWEGLCPPKTVIDCGNSGTTLRLRDRGIRNRKSGQRGHQLITLQVVLPVAEELELVVVASLFERRTAGLYHNTAVVFDARMPIFLNF